MASRDANGNLNAQIFDGLGRLVEERHADGGVVQYRLDAFGNRIAMRGAAGELTAYTYDKLGRLIQTRRAAGVGVATYSSSGAGSPTASLTALGNREQVESCKRPANPPLTPTSISC